MLKLTINGKPQTVEVAEDTPLLWVLRDQLGMTGTKYSCGMALCGACTVHLDGEPVRSIRLAGLAADRVYQITDQDTQQVVTASGARWMQEGVAIDLSERTSALLLIEAKGA